MHIAVEQFETPHPPRLDEPNWPLTLDQVKALDPEIMHCYFGIQLEPITMLDGIRSTYFPMPEDAESVADFYTPTPQVLEQDPDLNCWYSPANRGVITPNSLKVSKSLRRSCKRFTATINKDFAAVVKHCQNLERPGSWLNEKYSATYNELHTHGWAHSVEIWDENQDLVGGLFGIQVQGVFSGESMFHLKTDASKVALVALVETFERNGGHIVDTQFQTEHLETMGAQTISRSRYCDLLKQALICDATPLGHKVIPELPF